MFIVNDLALINMSVFSDVDSNCRFSLQIFKSFDYEHSWWSLFQKSAHQIRYLRFYCVDTTAGGLFVHEGIIRPSGQCFDTGGLFVHEGIIRPVASVSTLVDY
jgi:hypothetical protein